MDQRLMEAAQAGDVNALYAAIREDPYILEAIDQIPFVDTPLHVAASVGCTHFAIEVMSLKPSFGKKLNPDGHSPLGLALRNKHTETVRRLVSFDSELIRVKGKERMTLLHYVAETDDKDLLAEFLCICPRSIEDLSVRGETAVHIAVRKGSFEAFKVLLGWLCKTYKQGVLSWKDEDGNTVLHIAAITNQTQVVKLLMNNRVNKNARNLEGLTALDLSEANRDVSNILIHAKASKGSSHGEKTTSLADYLSSPQLNVRKFFQYFRAPKMNMSSEMRSNILVVAVLIATATYQAVLSPPGGVWQGDNSSPILNTTTNINATASGKNQSAHLAIVTAEAHFLRFLSVNTIAFATSLGVISMFLDLSFPSVVLNGALLFLMCSYMVSATCITPNRYATVLTVFQYLLFGSILELRLFITGLELLIFSRVSFGRYNPSHFHAMRREIVGH